MWSSYLRQDKHKAFRSGGPYLSVLATVWTAYEVCGHGGDRSVDHF
jgi:hypothetical protein